ncbi:MAG TPA: hypothetical protein VLG76_08890 [Rhabdochlamydiaceae bacterium]|nr:hypothetical protein [Rhabdochlamydiaceae bacterium]
MNKNRQPLDARTRRKNNKTIRDAQSAFAKKEPPVLSDQLKVDDLLKKYPPKMRAKDKSLLDSQLKTMKIEKKVKTVSYHTHSKRTTPGEVEGRDSTPAHVHPESAKWDKNLKLQNTVNNKSFNKKMLKKK